MEGEDVPRWSQLAGKCLLAGSLMPPILPALQTRTTLADLPQMVGTFAWIAPEVLLGSPCTLQVDLYSFGEWNGGHLKEQLPASSGAGCAAWRVGWALHAGLMGRRQELCTC